MRAESELRLYKALMALVLINFVVFFVVANAIGGDAVNGFTKDGHFFLVNHGKATEVSEVVFTYSKWHVYSVWATYGCLFVAGFRYRYLKRHGDA
jgi:hypothetical protein